MLNLYRVEDNFDRSYIVTAVGFEEAVQVVLGKQIEEGKFTINTCYSVVLLNSDVGGKCD